MITSNVAYAALAYLPINPRSQASLQRALVAKSAATIVATIQSNPSEQRKHKNYFLAQNLVFLPSLPAFLLNESIGHSYASINALYSHSSDKILFYLAKIHPNVCLYEIFVVLLSSYCKMR